MRKKPSLYPDERQCFICGNAIDVVRHHIFPGNGRRHISDEEGCWVYLCPAHHNMSDRGVHFDHELDAFFRRDAQARWERRERLEGDEAHDEFRKRFGISYL